MLKSYIVDQSVKTVAAIEPWCGYFLDDYPLLTNTKAQAKIRKVFDRSEFVWNLRWLKGRPDGRFGMPRDQLPPPIAGEITCWFTNNITSPSSFHLLTPWMICHRIGHALTLFQTENNPDCTFEKAIHRFFQSVLQVLIATDNFKTKEYNDYYLPSFRKPTSPRRVLSIRTGARIPVNRVWSMEDLASIGGMSLGKNANSLLEGFLMDLLPTMKSARERAILSMVELHAEIFAQYMVTGSVRFRRVADWLQLPRDDSFWFDELPSESERLDQLMAAAEQEISAAIQHDLENCVGTNIIF